MDFDYTPQIRDRLVPDSLREWATEHLTTHAAVYEMAWGSDDDWIYGIYDRPKKARYVRVTCSACGGQWDADYVKGEKKTVSYGADKPFGFTQDGIPIREMGTCECPYCEEGLKAFRASAIRRVGGLILDEAWCNTATLLDREPGKRPALGLLEWCCRRVVSAAGIERDVCILTRACAFEERKIINVNGIVNLPYGTGFVPKELHQIKRHGLPQGLAYPTIDMTTGLVERSCLPHCKAEKMVDVGCSVHEYIQLYQRCHNVETLAQHTPDILGEAINSEHVGLFDLDAKSPAAILRLSKESFRRCRDERWSLRLWTVYRYAEGNGWSVSPEVLKWIKRLPHCPTGVFTDAHPDRVYRYLHNRENDIIMLRDYWDNARKAGWDLSNASVRWPKNLRHAHDAASDAAFCAENSKTAAGIMARAATLDRYSYSSGKLLIYPASCLSDLLKESDQLHHCVKTYAQRIADGKTSIFFIRHTADPLQSFFTLELDEETLAVRQNRGRYNCERTDEVRKFEQEWLGWLHGGARRQKNGAPVGAEPVEIPANLIKQEDTNGDHHSTEIAAA